MVGPVSNGVDVRRHLVPPLVDVHLDRGLGVNREPLIGVDRHAEETGVGLKNTTDEIKSDFFGRMPSLT